MELVRLVLQVDMHNVVNDGGGGGGGHVSIFYGTDSFGSGTVSANAAPASVPAPNNPYHPSNPGPDSPSPVRRKRAWCSGRKWHS